MQTTISFIIAVYNEAPENLHALTHRLVSIAESQGFSYEIVFVNDGSRQEATDALRKIAGAAPFVKLIELSRNFGQQAAITAGLNHATGDVIVNLDSDFQDPPDVVVEMLSKWRNGFEVVSAVRSTRKDSSLKRISAFAFYRILGQLSTIEIPSDTGDFRLFDRKVVRALNLMPERTRFIRGLVPWLGFRQGFVEINRDAREVGKSGYTLGKLLKLAFDGLISFSVAPLFSIIGVGAVISMTGALLLISRIWFGFSLERGAVEVIGVLTLGTGLQITSTGIVAIYISKILDEVRARPTYVVSNIITSNANQRDLENVFATTKTDDRDLLLSSR